MGTDTLDKVSDELLFIPPLISRITQRRILRELLNGLDLDVSPIHIEVMKLLEVNGRLNITEIAEELKIARAQMTHIIDRLADLKMIKKQAGKEDRRVVNITLTANGKSTLEEQGNCVRNTLKEVLSNLTEEDLKGISLSLQKLRYALLKAL
jgi:DNA-binding MarR family transcriptional regulator